jgi:hypothetical protein
MSVKYELNQQVSWQLDGQEMVGRIVSIDLNYYGVPFYSLCENGSHPRNGCYTRMADEIQAV